MDLSSRSSLNNIFKSSTLLKNTVSETNKTTKVIKSTLNDGLTKKRNIWSSTKILKKRRDEFENRKINDRKLLTSKLVVTRGGPKLLSSSDSGTNIVGRLLGFIKYLSSGWILGNLPTWISSGQQLINRITIATKILSNYGDETLRVITGISNVFNSAFRNVMNFDFTDSSNDLKTSLDDLKSSIDELGEGLSKAFSALFEPFKNVPPIGEISEEPDAYSPDQTPIPTPTPSSENQTRASYGTREQRAMLDAIAWAEGGDKITYKTMFGGKPFDTSRGWKHPDRVIRSGGYASAAAGRYQFMPDTWAEASKALGLKDFSPINQDKAAIWLMDKRLRGNSAEILRKEGVSNRVLNAFAKEWAAVPMAGGGSFYEQSARRVKDFRNKYNSILKATPSVAKGSPTPIIPSPQTSKIPTTVIDEVNVAAGGIPRVGRTGGRGEYRARGGRHKGIDIGTNYQKGYYVSFAKKGKVTYAGWNDGGYGYLVIIQSGNLEFYFAHLAKIMVKNNSQYNGETIGEIGNTGHSRGEHLHFEVRKVGEGPINPETYLKYLSIGTKFKALDSNTNQIASLKPSSSRINFEVADNKVEIQSDSKTSLNKITQERKKQQIVVIDDRQPQISQQIIKESNNIFSSTEINEYTLVNNFIKNKLLLDLTYL